MQANREWISIADLMAGLMMVFMFIAIIFMISAEREKNAMGEIALTYEQSRIELRDTLEREFESDLARWGAEILKDSTIRFREPDILFARNSSEINEKFQNILADFFPRYASILASDKFRDEIDEVRIEGHTSSDWTVASTKEVAYLSNARLSQSRSLSVLQFVYMLPEIIPHRSWLSGVIRSNGLSYAKRIYLPNGNEDRVRSRRVEFRVITKAEEKIYTILKSVRRES